MTTTHILEIAPELVATTVEKLYQRTEKSMNEDVSNLKKWMETQPHLPEVLTEKMLQNFLIRSKFSIEKAKQKIDMYYTVRSKFPHFFINNNPECVNVKKAMESFYWAPLSKMVDGIYPIIVFKIRNKEMFSAMDLSDGVKFVFNFYELRLMESAVFGEVVIFDCEDMSFTDITKFTPSFLITIFTIYEKVCSISLKGLYFINSPPFLSTPIAILKKILKPKLFERIYVYEDTSILKKKFSNETLPKDYGGEEMFLEEIQNLVKEMFYQHKKRFDKLDEMRVDESLRPEKFENDESLGFYGNFKQLDFD